MSEAKHVTAMSGPIIINGVTLPPARRGHRNGAGNKTPERIALESLAVSAAAEFPLPANMTQRRWQQRLGALAWEVTTAARGEKRFATRLIQATATEGAKVWVCRTA